MVSTQSALPQSVPNPQLDIRIGTLVPGAKNPAAYIAQILPHGFESFSLTFSDRITVDLEKTAQEVRAVLGDRAVISSVGLYGNPLQSEETARDYAVLLDNLHHFGCTVAVGFAGAVEGKPVPESIPRFKEVWTPLVKRAEDRGARIAFENCDMGGWWHGPRWNIAHAPSAWELMFDAVPSAALGLQWEPCHQMVSLIDPLPQLRKWLPKIFHVHGKDATIAWDIVRSEGIRGGKPYVWHRTPGFGDTNWSDVITILRQGGFTGSIDIEGWHDPVYKDALEMTGQVHGLNHLKRCRGGDFVPNPSS